MLAGAVYVIAVPLGLLAEERVPHVGEQFDPFCIRDQETPVLLASLETVAVNCCVVPSKTFAAVGDTETEMGGVTVTVAAVAVAEAVVSATEVATMVTSAFTGTLPGAVYVAAVPLGVVAGAMVPQPGEQDVPLCVSVQLTPLLPASFVTVAVNCCVPVTGTLAVAGETETAMGGVMVIVAAADFVVSATETALTVTCAGVGTADGAV